MRGHIQDFSQRLGRKQKFIFTKLIKILILKPVFKAFQQTFVRITDDQWDFFVIKMIFIIYFSLPKFEERQASLSPLAYNAHACIDTGKINFKWCILGAISCAPSTFYTYIHFSIAFANFITTYMDIDLFEIRHISNKSIRFFEWRYIKCAFTGESVIV